MIKEAREIAKKLEAQGWRVDYHRKGHAIAYPPDRSKRPVTIPGTPSDHRWKKNLIAELRRAGANL
jgi:predicted RNA binding protein YcfA (HicA-like mRNA interferase family)